MRGFLFNLMALLGSVVIVHLFYTGVVIPNAEGALQAAEAAGVSAPRNIFVIIKDMEQEICLILMLWGFYMIGTKCWQLFQDRHLFTIDFLQPADPNIAEEESLAEIQPAQGKNVDLREFMHTLEASQVSDKPLIQTWLSCIRRYVHTQDVQNASDALRASVESLAVRLETENAMIRYLIWAIPSIGFIGTVRGIGQALAQADAALAGDIEGMVDSLGIAFNSTLVALFISIILMFFFHQLQRLQDGMVVDTQEHCEKYLLKHLH